MNSNLKSTLLGGVIATAAMTILGAIAPMMGMPKMSVPNMLAGFMSMPIAIGWIAHFMIGTVLAAFYVYNWKGRFTNNAIVKGMLFSLLPFLAAQLIVMPMMGAGIFSMNTPAPMMMVMGGLIGHVVYGATLGAVVK